MNIENLLSLKAYFISGLGADQRVFYKIQLPPVYQPVYLEWITPLPDESFSQYAKRFSQLLDAHEDFILIGLSFGGLLASEIAKILSPQKLIIISSLACNKELPWYFKLAGKLGLHKIISPVFYKQATLINRFMGTGSKEMKMIVYDFVKKTDPQFIRWSLNAIVNWSQLNKLPNLVHIHGSRDHLLPCRYVKADYIVQKGGHLMVMNRAKEVNGILREILHA